jgi:hypothetical protein
MDALGRKHIALEVELRRIWTGWLRPTWQEFSFLKQIILKSTVINLAMAVV